MTLNVSNYLKKNHWVRPAEIHLLAEISQARGQEGWLVIPKFSIFEALLWVRYQVLKETDMSVLGDRHVCALMELTF